MSYDLQMNEENFSGSASKATLGPLAAVARQQSMCGQMMRPGYVGCHGGRLQSTFSD